MGGWEEVLFNSCRGLGGEAVVGVVEVDRDGKSWCLVLLWEEESLGVPVPVLVPVLVLAGRDCDLEGRVEEEEEEDNANSLKQYLRRFERARSCLLRSRSCRPRS